MKQFYFTLMALAILSSAKVKVQTGPNLLGAKGTFSAPFVTPNVNADPCTDAGTHSYNPVGDIGNALNTLTGAGPAKPGSAYTYTAASGGLQPEFTYTLIKNIGDNNGGNCIKGDWRGQDHTGDGGWFMAVNGAPNNTKSPIFYKISSIAVCAGTQYEFSAWVLNILPKSSPYAKKGSEPNISFRVTANGVQKTIATSGPIAYTSTPTWVKVSGTYTAPSTVSSVDLEVINATAVALGNDLGLDDISFNVVSSNITLSGINGPLQNAVCENSNVGVLFTVNDATQTNSWCKWQISTDGGETFTDNSTPAQATFSGNSYSLSLNLNNVTTSMNGYKYRLVVSTSQAGLDNPTCTFVNEYTLIVNACGPTPVTLTYFNGKYTNGVAILDWQTSQEMNSDRYEVYRSTDGQQFSYMGSVKAAGYSNVVKNYTFNDNQPGNSQYVYYRLKQVDMDGKFVYTNVVKINTGNHASMEVYPNPFTSYFTTSFTASKTADAILTIRNSIGQPVMQRTIKAVKGSNSVNITNLPSLTPGIYYVTISNDDINYNIKMQKQ